MIQHDLYALMRMRDRSKLGVKTTNNLIKLWKSKDK